MEVKAQKPIAELTITARPSGALTYLLYREAGELLLEIRGYSTERGRECVRERIRTWNNGRFRIVMAVIDKQD